MQGKSCVSLQGCGGGNSVFGWSFYWGCWRLGVYQTLLVAGCFLLGPLLDGSVSPTAQKTGCRFAWSNSIYTREPTLETENSILESKECNAEITESNELCSAIGKAHAIIVEEKETVNDSLKENENWDGESSVSTWYTPIGTHSPTSEKRSEAQALQTGQISLQSTEKTLLQTENAALQTVLNANDCDSATEKKNGTEQVGTEVKNDNIDLRIEAIEKEISRLTQKLAELKLQKTNCEVQSHADVKESTGKMYTPMKVANKTEIKNSPQQGSSGKEKRGRFISAKFRQCDSNYQMKYEQNLFETSSTRKINSIQTPQTRRRAVTLGPSGPQLCRTPSEISNIKVDNFKEKNDKGDGKQNPKKNDLSTDAMRESDAPERFDCKENICQHSVSPLEKNLICCTHSKFKELNLSPLENKISFCTHLKSKELGPSPLQWEHNFCTHSKSKEVFMGDKVQGRIKSMNLEGRKSVQENHKKLFELSENKEFQKLSSNDPVGHCSKVELSHRESKVYPSCKHTRIVPSRYGGIVTSNKDASSTIQSPANLSSLRNAHGKRISSEIEFNDVKSRAGEFSSKRPVVGCVACISSSKDFIVENGYPNRSGLVPSSKSSPQNSTISNHRTQTSAIPNSRSPQNLSERIATAKTPSPCFKDGKKTSKLTRVLPARQGLRAKKQQTLCVEQKEHSKRSQTISVERNINKPFDQYSESCLKESISSVNQEKVLPVCTRQSCLVGYLCRDSLEPERIRLPKISTLRFTAKSSRDSGCTKRAVDQ